MEKAEKDEFGDEEEVFHEVNEENPLEDDEANDTKTEDTKEVNEANEYQNEEEAEEMIAKVFTIEHPEYKNYKNKILGRKIPSKRDHKCEFYYMDDKKQITKFISKIKSLAINQELSQSHINKIIRQFIDDGEIYLITPIALIEYTEFSTDEPKNLIEVLDGHHRIEALKEIVKNDNLDIPMMFWIQIYKAPTPDSKEAITLFKRYNNTKPFKLDIDILDAVLLIIGKLNERYNNPCFEFIKDTEKNIQRPSIRKKEFVKLLSAKLSKQSNDLGTELTNDIIYNIVKKFDSYNKTLLGKNYDYFTNKKNPDYYASTTPVSKRTFEKACENKCFLGLINLKYLIEQYANF